MATLMRFDVVTLFPDFVQTLTEYGVIGRAADSGILQVQCWNPRDFTHDKHRTVDDKPYGGGPGMLMKVQPLQDAIQAARQAAEQATGQQTKVVYLSPQGKRFDQQLAREQGDRPLCLVAGRYEGIDERLLETDIDEEWSIGDYVLSGGELAAMVVMDTLTRLQPGALGDDESAQADSFMSGLLDHPHFTRPDEINGLKVPAVLLSGDHQAIQRWRLQQALGRTWLRRPDLLQQLQLDEEQQQLLEEFKREFEKT